MSTVIASNVRWTSGSPAIYLTFAYDKYRNGKDMLYQLNVKVSTISGASYYGYPINCQIALDGTTVATKQIKGSSPSQWTTALSYTTPYVTVANKTSGTTTVKFRVYNSNGRDQSYTYQLAIDPAMSTVTATDANIESGTVITINRANDAFTHTLRYKFEGQAEYTTLVENLNAVTYGWTIPASTYQLIPNARSINCEIQCETFSGETSLGTSETTIVCTASVDRCAPVVSGTVIDTNATTIALTGDNTRLVRYVSNALATITATARNGATIVSKAVNGTVLEGNTKTFEKVETGAFNFSATDSRTLTGTATVERVLVPYVPLSIAAQFIRTSPTNNEIAVRFNGNVYNGYFDAGNTHQNALNVQVRYRVNGAEAWSAWQNVSFTRSGETFISGTGGEYVSLGSVFDYTNAYDFQIQAVDSVSSGGIVGDSYRTVSKGIPIFDWGEEDFNFNVPIHQNGEALFPLSIANGGTGVTTIEDLKALFDAVEWGTSDGWTYRKWSNGKVEAWKRVSTSLTSDATAGATWLKYSAFKSSNAVTYPSIISTIDTLITNGGNVGNNATWGMWVSAEKNDTTRKINIGALYWGSTASYTASVDLYIIGESNE